MNGRSIVYEDIGRAYRTSNLPSDLSDLAGPANLYTSYLPRGPDVTPSDFSYDSLGAEEYLSPSGFSPNSGVEETAVTSVNNTGSAGLASDSFWGDSKSLLDYDDLARQAAQSTATAETVSTVAGGVGSGLATGAGAISGPLAIAAMLNQVAGGAVNSVMAGSDQATINKDFLHNVQQHGLNTSLNANIIKQGQETKAASASAFGSAGATLGPIWAALGHALGLGGESVNPDTLRNSASFGGSINASQEGIVASQTTATGQTDSVLQNTL